MPDMPAYVGESYTPTGYNPNILTRAQVVKKYNLEENQILFQSDEKDGNIQDSVFKKWFGDWENTSKHVSKVIDENGEPLAVYHGTNSEIEIFDKSKIGSRENAFFFTSDKNNAKEWGGSKEPIAVFLNAKNLVELDSDYEDVDGKSYYPDKEEFWVSHDGYVVDKDEFYNEYAVSSPNQIKSINNYGEFNLNNDSILFQSADKQTSVVENKNKGTLVALHNISENNLVKSYNLGGMPMPSIAITKPGIAFNYYGEITLVGGYKLGNELIE